jgi:hypothetical protein
MIDVASKLAESLPADQAAVTAQAIRTIFELAGEPLPRAIGALVFDAAAYALAHRDGVTPRQLLQMRLDAMPTDDEWARTWLPRLDTDEDRSRLAALLPQTRRMH